MTQCLPAAPCLLLSVDLETTGYDTPGDAARFPAIVARITDWMARHGARATFFCTGDVLREYPSLVLALAEQGHEIACHGWQHVPLERVGPAGLEQDLAAFLQCAAQIGLPAIAGYRAPFFSLTRQTAWAIDILQAQGFAYDSSIIPARTVLYGYPGTVDAPQRHANGVLEMPVTVWRPVPMLNAGIPAFGGTYLRLMPSAMIHRLLQQQAVTRPVLAYFHPYDNDPALASVSAFSGNPLYNRLLTVGRATMLDKLELLLANRTTMTMRQWASAHAGDVL